MEQWKPNDAVNLFFSDGFKDGDLVSHDWILYALDLPEIRTKEDSLSLLERMEAFRKELLQCHQIALQNVRGEGYRVVPPAEQAEYAARLAANHIEKGMRKADSLLSNTRQDQLTAAERQRHVDTEVRMASLRGMVGRGKRDVFKLFAPEG